MNTMITGKRLALSCATALLFIAATSQANAQNKTTATGPDDEGLAEIVVTARKQSERLIDVPLAITAFNS